MNKYFLRHYLFRFITSNIFPAQLELFFITLSTTIKRTLRIFRYKSKCFEIQIRDELRQINYKEHPKSNWMDPWFLTLPN